MPRVGNKHFPYTPAGRAAAAKAAKSLPSQASATAKSRAFGVQGTAMKTQHAKASKPPMAKVMPVRGKSKSR